MSTNKQALRNLATVLDGDDWHAEGNSVYGGAYDFGDNVCYDHIASCESVNGESPHADFIAAANPATVLALLDELEAKEKYAKERDAENEDLMLTVGRLRVEREAREKRIAELEGRHVTLELPHDSEVEFVADRCNRHREAKAAAGITVKGE